ncbi:MAG: putative zinc-binding protein [Acidobacteriota bacterium]
MKPKAVIIPCSGIGKTLGSVARESAFRVTEDLCPQTSRLMPLSLLVLGEDETRSTLASTPVIAIDGCTKSCAAKVAAERGGTVRHALQVSDVFKRHRGLKPEGVAELNQAGQQLAQALAEEVAALMDRMDGEMRNA